MKKRLIVIPIVVAVAAAALYFGLRSRPAAPSNVLKISGNIEVTSVELSDDADHVYEVEIDLGDGKDVDVELDGAFTVVKAD